MKVIRKIWYGRRVHLRLSAAPVLLSFGELNVVRLSHWITIGGKPDAAKGTRHSGGVRVVLDDEGTILGGNVPRGLRGKKISQFKQLIEHHKKGGKSDESDDSGDGRPGDGPGDGPGGGRDARQPAGAGGGVAPEARGPGDARAGGKRRAPGKPAGEKATRRIPASQHEVNRRLDRFEKLFRERGNHQAADWMGLLRNHVDTVGTDEALRSLGEDAGKGDREETRYEGEQGGWEDVSDFARAYLNRNGIVSVYQAAPTADVRTISSSSPEFGGEGGAGHAQDFQPTDPTLKDKLAEAQSLPGLEASEDIDKIVGKPVTHLTPEVLAKMDEKYGQGKWIIKTYGDYAFAGNGIFFPQRAAQIARDARDTIWSAGENLSRYGFQLRRDESGKVVGLEHRGGDRYDFGSEKYESTIGGEARHWGDRAAAAAGSENGAELPEELRGAMMAQPAFPVVGITNEERARGITFKRGQEARTHIVTRNGKAELIPHTTWLKEEPLPIVFEDDETRAMAQAAVDAINALPESERQGQIYAPDIVRTADGYRVVEANPANATGSSGYLGDNPFIIDSYVSHLTGRSPAHVRFIRKLLSTRKKSS